MTVADRIRERRIELDMTQKDLAAKIGTKDRSSISKIESHGNDISMKDIVRIAEALDVSPQYLLGWDDDDGIRDHIRGLISGLESAMYLDHMAKDSTMVTDDGTRLLIERRREADELYGMYENAPETVRNIVKNILKEYKPKP